MPKPSHISETQHYYFIIIFESFVESNLLAQQFKHSGLSAVARTCDRAVFCAAQPAGRLGVISSQFHVVASSLFRYTPIGHSRCFASRQRGGTFMSRRRRGFFARRRSTVTSCTVTALTSSHASAICPVCYGIDALARPRTECQPRVQGRILFGL
jgi:hypothetical protein